MSISVIIPVYKAEDYISTCINSILSQKYTDFELILVDDGSPDNSGDICDRFAKIDNRVKVFHQENKGVSAARNLGLEKAKGEWVCFIDSDDYISDNAFEVFSRDMDSDKSCDILIYGLTRINNYTEKRNIQEKFRSKNASYVIEMLFNRKISTSLCAKFYKRKLFKDLILDEEQNFGEDALLLVKLFNAATAVAAYEDNIYFYTVNIDSATNNHSDYTLYNDMKSKIKIKNFIKENYPSSYTSLFQSLNNFIMICYYDYIIRANDLKSMFISFDKSVFKNYFFSLRKEITIRKIFIICIYSIMYVSKDSKSIINIVQSSILNRRI